MLLYICLTNWKVDMAVSFKGKLFKEINPDGAAMLRPELNPELDIDTLLATSKKQGTFCCLKNDIS